MPRSFGSAGSGIGGAEGRRKYGANADVGAMGEKQFAQALVAAGLTSRYDVYYSLSIPDDPRNRSATRYSSDVDVALTSGRRLVLVDVKMWKSGAAYWSLGGMPFRGFMPLYQGKGADRKWKPLSANMAAALARYRANLPGVEVSAITVFVGTGRAKAMPSSVFFLRWPGRIRSYLCGDGVRVISKRLGVGERTEERLRSFVSARTKGGR